MRVHYEEKRIIPIRQRTQNYDLSKNGTRENKSDPKFLETRVKFEKENPYIDFVFSTSRCVDVSRKDVNSILSQPKSDKRGFTGAPPEGFYLKSVPEYINCYMVITPSICEREIKRC